MLALRQALKELARQGSWEGRRERYLKLAGLVRESLAGLGVEALLEADQASSALTSYRIPEGMNWNEIHDGLKRWGFVVFGGQGSLARKIFQVSTMGDITRYDLERLLAAIETVFKRR